MRVFRTLLVAGLAGIASVANAGIVPTWGYSVTSVFNNNCVFTNGAAPQPNTSCGPTLIEWGVPDTIQGQSHLSITDSTATGSVNTDTDGGLPSAILGQIGPTNTFTHHNFPVFPPFLLSAEVETTLTLFPNSPAGPPQVGPFPSLTIPILFKETPNAGPCVNGDPTPCPDIFVIIFDFNSFVFWYDDVNNLLSPGPAPGFQRYLVNIFPNPDFNSQLASLDPDYCAAVVGAPNPCFGFVTQEFAESSVQYAFSIGTEELTLVPEPGILALFALGLVGLGFTARRRQV